MKGYVFTTDVQSWQLPKNKTNIETFAKKLEATRPLNGPNGLIRASWDITSDKTAPPSPNRLQEVQPWGRYS
jgi:hypothetical protein